MPRKIIDIFPPEPAESLPRIIQAPKRNIGKRTLTAVFLVLFLSLAVLQFFFTKAEAEIWLVTKVLTVSERITVDSGQDALDFENKVIPGKIFQTQSEVADEFAASGTFLKKAEGVIRLYNNFTTQRETWLADTRFVSSEGKLFLSKDRIQVPGAAINNGRLSSSFLDVPVIAAQGGEEYNIGSSNFSVVAFRGTPRFTSYYGQSSGPMVGGGMFPRVAQEDLEQAGNTLIETAKLEAQKSFANIIPREFVFLNEAQDMEILATSSSAVQGDEAEKFKFELKADSKVIVFESEHTEELAKFLINSVISPEDKPHYESLKFEYKTETVNLESGKIVISLTAFVKTYQELDINSLKRTLSGMPLSEARALLSNQSDIVRAQVKTFPFWLRSLPKQPDRITVKLNID